jgi:hypothetical protein
MLTAVRADPVALQLAGPRTAAPARCRIASLEPAGAASLSFTSRQAMDNLCLLVLAIIRSSFLAVLLRPS